MAGSPVVGWGEDANITLVVQVQGSHLQYTRHVSARIAGGPELQTTVLRIFYAQPGAEAEAAREREGPRVAVGLGRFFTRRGEEPPLPLTHSSPLHPTSSPETMTPISHSDDHSSSSSSRTSPLIDTLTTTAPWDSIPMPNSTPAATSTAIPSRTGSSSSAQGTSHMLVEVTLPRAHLAAARAAPDSSLYLHLRSDFHETVAAVSLAPHRAAIIGTSPYAASLVHAALMATLPEEREEEEESAEPATVSPLVVAAAREVGQQHQPMGAGSATLPPQPHPAEATRPLIAAVPPQTSQSAQAITPLPNHAATPTHSIATHPPLPVLADNSDSHQTVSSDCPGVAGPVHSAQQAVASHAAVSDGRLSTVVPSVLPAPLFARWEVLKGRYIGSDGGIERWRPIFASQELYRKALKANQLSRSGGVQANIDVLAKKYAVAETPTDYPVEIEHPRDAIKAFKASGLDDIACFGRTLDAVEQDMPAMTVRANAWASGDLDALRKLPDSDRRGTCVSAITDADFARKLGLSDVPARMEANWLVLARASLAKNAQTFALLPIKELLSPTGYLSRLKAEGYRVAAPDDDSYDDDPAASGTAAQPATAVPGVATH
ncbi:MAG: hypothetical protein WDW36_000584 [Sanguina aurantia]